MMRANLLSPRPAAVTLRLSLLLLCVAAAVPQTSAARPVQIEGVRFAPEIEAGNETLVLNGYALLRYKVLFKAYVAALYLEPNTPADRVLSDVPKRLEIEYFWSISASDFARATDAGVSANLSAAEVERLQPQIEALNRLYRDVNPGDRYALTYVPKVGTELALNGKALGTVPGDDFASAVFSIWLGKNPLDAGLKTALLGK